MESKITTWLMVTGCLLKVVALASQTTQFPFITDYGSYAGSKASLEMYEKLEQSQRNLTIEVQTFSKDYSKRSRYLNGAASILAIEINTELAAAIKRYEHLTGRNKSLSFINYSKRKKNTKLLKLIHKMLMNLMYGLSKQHTVNVRNGEKMNLYQNTMESLTEIHQLMDTVEDQVRQSVLLDMITRRN